MQRRPETPRRQSATTAACAPFFPRLLPALRATLQHIFPHLDREHIRDEGRKGERLSPFGKAARRARGCCRPAALAPRFPRRTSSGIMIARTSPRTRKPPLSIIIHLPLVSQNWDGTIPGPKLRPNTSATCATTATALIASPVHPRLTQSIPSPSSRCPGTAGGKSMARFRPPSSLSPVRRALALRVRPLPVCLCLT